MSHIDVMKQALEALKANSLLVNGDDKRGGLVWCMDGYYADCFDIEAVNKQTDESITALNRAIANEALDQMAENAKELGLSYEQQFQSTADKSKLETVPANGGLLPAQQEPVAWLYHDANSLEEMLKAERDGLAFVGSVLLSIRRHKEYRNETPLYTSPPAQRTWVGLTSDEVLDIEETTRHPLAFYRAIEAKLKEKNQ